MRWGVFVKKDGAMEIRSWKHTNSGSLMSLQKFDEYRLCPMTMELFEQLAQDAFMKNPIVSFNYDEINEILGVSEEDENTPETDFLRNELRFWEGSLLSESNFADFLKMQGGGFSMHNYICYLDMLRLAEFYPRNETCPIHQSFCQKIVPLVGDRWNEDVSIDFLCSMLSRDSAQCFHFLSDILQKHTEDPERLFEF